MYVTILSTCRGYMRRFKKRGRRHGDVVYLITASWFRSWEAHTSYKVMVCCRVASLLTEGLCTALQDGASVSNGPTLTHKKSKRKRKKTKIINHPQVPPSQYPQATPPPSQHPQGHFEHGEEAIEILHVGRSKSHCWQANIIH